MLPLINFNCVFSVCNKKVFFFLMEQSIHLLTMLLKHSKENTFSLGSF